MNTYLVIITTALVVTQVIRLIQNAISLHKNNILLKKQLGDISDVTQKDFDTQREAYRLIVEYLSKEEQKDETMQA